MSDITDIMMMVLLVGGGYYLLSSGKLDALFKQIAPAPQAAPTPTPAAEEPAPAAAEEEAPAPAPTQQRTAAGPPKVIRRHHPPATGGGGGTGGGGTGSVPATGGPAPTGTTCPQGAACGTSNAGSRNECDGVTAKAYEATWCGTFSGDDLSVKTFGPNHSGSSCCWCILSVSPEGAFGIRQEGPHPSTSSKTATTAAIGKPSCIKAIVRPGNGGINLEGWGLVGGTWKKAFTYSGPCGSSKKSTTPAPQQQVAFRCDGSLKTTCATVRPLDGGGGAGVARVYHALARSEYDRILTRT